MTTLNADPQELAKFGELAHNWWDPDGEFRPLHQINPLRLDWIDAQARLDGKTALDVGCGGGILSESMAARGADVLGIDLSTKPLRVAQLHAMEAGQDRLRYREVAVEVLAAEVPASFDVVTCMEMLEHVPDPASMVGTLGALLRPGGDLFLSTLNRTPKAFAVAIVGAEYLARLLPRGTHEYAKFIRPSEIAAAARHHGLECLEIAGLNYNPITGFCTLTRDPSVNYLVHLRRAGPVSG